MNQVVMVTGSTRGIGSVIAKEFAKKGYTTVIHGSKPSKEGDLILREIKSHAPKSIVKYFDISDRDEVNNNIKDTISKLKRIDILINNAGVKIDSTLINMSYESWDKVIKTNLYGAFFLCQAVVPHMINNKFGRIINISSIAAHLGVYGSSNYSASKAAVLGLTKSLAKELAQYGILVNAVIPGLVKTQMMDNIPEKYLKPLIQNIPLKRAAEPKEIANLVIYLSQKENSYINGAAIDINGGWL